MASPAGATIDRTAARGLCYGAPAVISRASSPCPRSRWCSLALAAGAAAALGAAAPPESQPRVLVQIFESRPVEGAGAGDLLARRLGQEGFAVVGPTDGRPARALLKPDSPPVDSQDFALLAARAAAAAGADLIVLGQVSTSTGAARSLTGAVTSTGSALSLRAVRARTGEVLWADREVGTHLGAIAASLGARFAPELHARWTEQVASEANLVELVISDATGTLRVEDLRELEDGMFLAVEGVEEITQRTLDDRRAVLQIIDPRGPAQLRGALEGFRLSERRCHVVGAAGRRIEVVLEPRPGAVQGRR